MKNPNLGSVVKVINGGYGCRIADDAEGVVINHAEARRLTKGFNGEFYSGMSETKKSVMYIKSNREELYVFGLGYDHDVEILGETKLPQPADMPVIEIAKALANVEWIQVQADCPQTWEQVTFLLSEIEKLPKEQGLRLILKAMEVAVHKAEKILPPTAIEELMSFKYMDLDTAWNTEDYK